MRIGRTDYGNKIQGIEKEDVEKCFGGTFEAGDFFRIFNSGGSPIATYLVMKK